jgi:hypothetical protein
VCRSFDDDADFEMKGRDRWGDPMAGKLNKKKLGDGFDLPPPVITEANRAMMEASGRAEGGGKRGEMVLVARGPQQGGGGGVFPKAWIMSQYGLLFQAGTLHTVLLLAAPARRLASCSCC